ncbi:ICMT-domain-containing protein [Pseudovirgaria hyperparasitica]|uniref:Protein-S-isoprenylcysteine O-methyltransferase n=1 Tax=Pseudovirgaria hyperparasitica TaxID=470096 RepID=A0A6A6WMJ1_9PEZI|nr:ICMT-domain-containing protein [Pseudovirgaria hyperparasitica]KAF2763368.1 ICMT-domain-containing protein [Pseudovirgaria hyperparasitica]
MVQAGESFNHQVQSEWRAGHVLVTRGVYGVVRHPSYWGFFWWGVGSQVLVGNVGCGVVYACVLWRFFARRIASEERYLVGFFGEEYVRFRARTPVGIPFIA